VPARRDPRAQFLIPRLILLGLLQGAWTCKGIESGTVFDNVVFEDGNEWMDYDEKVSVRRCW
jgi:hypothetical protein